MRGFRRLLDMAVLVGLAAAIVTPAATSADQKPRCGWPDVRAQICRTYLLGAVPARELFYRTGEKKRLYYFFVDPARSKIINGIKDRGPHDVAFSICLGSNITMLSSNKALLHPLEQWQVFTTELKEVTPRGINGPQRIIMKRYHGRWVVSGIRPYKKPCS